MFIYIVIYAILSKPSLTNKYTQPYVIAWQDIVDNGYYDEALGMALFSENHIGVTGGGYTDDSTDENCLTAIYFLLNGEKVWMDTLIFPDEASGTGISSSATSFYVVGNFSENINFTSVYYPFIARYLDDGTLTWMDTIPSDTQYPHYAIDIVSDTVYGSAYFLIRAGKHLDTRGFLIKYAKSGSITWTRSFDYGDYFEPTSIISDPQFENVYVAGYTSIASHTKIAVFRITLTGNIEDTFILQPDTSDYSYCDIKVDKDGIMYISALVGANNDIETFKYDPEADSVLWASIFYAVNNYQNIPPHIDIDSLGNIYTSGQIDGRAAILKYNHEGVLVWADTLPQTNINDMIATYNGIYVAARVNGYYWKVIAYQKFKDVAITSISLPDTVTIDSVYFPEAWVKNTSYELWQSFHVIATIDTNGGTVYEDTQYVSGLHWGDSTLVTFSPWSPSISHKFLTFTVHILENDMDSANNTSSKVVYSRDVIPPVIDSAIAYDGSHEEAGIDNDDYVILYFSEPTNKPDINGSSIDSVLRLSSGHTWLDGFGSVGDIVWNSDGTELLINLTSYVSPPTVNISDTIYPDSSTIEDLDYNRCFSPAVLGGSFGPSNIKEEREKYELNVPTVQRGDLTIGYNSFSNDMVNITIFNLSGGVVKKINRRQKGHIVVNLKVASGIYFIKIKRGKVGIIKKVLLIR